MRMIAASSVSLFIVLLFVVNCFSLEHEHGHEHEHEHHGPGHGHGHGFGRTWHKDVRSPCDIMVDVVNNIGLNILKVHNLNNDNNIALSPYGTVSILTALLEGVRGTAEQEIQKCGGFPPNRDIVRIGLRDIHRLLRTYFIPKEGFLSGLSLSTEKVILRPEYLSVLRFYGYDMTSFNTPIYPDLGTTTPMNGPTEYTTMPVDTEATLTTEKREEDDATTTKLPETTTTVRTTLPETTLPPTTVTVRTTQPETTLPPTTVTVRTTQPETTLQPTTIRTTLPETTLPPTTVRTTLPETTLPPTTVRTTLPETTLPPTTVTTVRTTLPETTPPPTTIPTETTTDQPTTLTTLPARSKRSIVHYLIPGHDHPHAHDAYNPDFPRYNSIEHTNAFLVNGQFPESHVNFMTYETVLPFYYIPNLNALALRFPLDSPKYYLLLILPVDDTGIDRIICDIGNAITLKQIISHLHPTYVRAVIPSFTLRGLVSLTGSLQKIGIKEIFEPYKADFSPLTNDTNVYVTNIEQAITVIIKNYMMMMDNMPQPPPPPHNINNRNLYHHQHHEEPVEFKATHPFLYFVMDSEIDVALIAGKIVNPINSRIQ